MNVQNELGCGFLEAVYQEALSIEFNHNNIPFQKEKPLNIYYKERLLTKKYVADYICFDQIIVELKAMDSLAPEHTAQVLNYLKATGCTLAILLNFGSKSLMYKRVIMSENKIMAS